MPKIFIPVLKQKLKLEQDWTFPLYEEHRNETLWYAFGLTGSKPGGFCAYWANNNKKSVTLPRDTILQVDRLYIKNGLNDYDSVTFKVLNCPLPQFNTSEMSRRKMKARFWAKLNDVQGLEVELIN